MSGAAGCPPPPRFGPRAVPAPSCAAHSKESHPWRASDHSRIHHYAAVPCRAVLRRSIHCTVGGVPLPLSLRLRAQAPAAHREAVQARARPLRRLLLPTQFTGARASVPRAIGALESNARGGGQHNSTPWHSSSILAAVVPHLIRFPDRHFPGFPRACALPRKSAYARSKTYARAFVCLSVWPDRSFVLC